MNETDTINLDLDLDEAGPKGSGENVARISVRNALSFTRDGAGPTISSDCTSYRTLELEVARLKFELDVALGRGATYFEVARKNARDERADQVSLVREKRGARARLKTKLKVHELMTPGVRTLDENEKLSVAGDLMNEGAFRHVVAVDKYSKVVGVVSHRDMFFSAIAWATGAGRFAHDKTLESLPVKSVMRKNPEVIAPGADLAEAAAVMTKYKIGCLPVMDGDELVGILTEGDFVALVV